LCGAGDRLACGSTACGRPSAVSCDAVGFGASASRSAVGARSARGEAFVDAVALADATGAVVPDGVGVTTTARSPACLRQVAPGACARDAANTTTPVAASTTIAVTAVPTRPTAILSVG
jgi:hypothetical protein